MTALALPLRAAAPTAPAVGGKAALRRAGEIWSQPEPWTVAVLLLTGVVVLARHPIAHLLGTEAGSSVASPTVVAAPAASPLATSPAVSAGAAAAVPTHAPRDPFRALVGASGKVLAPAAVVPVLTHHRPRPTQVPVTSGSCAGTVHTVAAGDSLWSIAARAVGTSDAGKVDIAWRRIYAANRPPLRDPNVIPVGTKLCVPTSI